MWSVKDISDAFFSLENKYNLNHEQIDGVYFWQLIRMYLYYDIARKLNTFGSPQQSSLKLSDKIMSFIPFLKNSILNSPFGGDKNQDILIFDHPRKVLYKNEYRDIYTYFLTNYLDEYNKDYEIIESPYLNNHFTNKSNKIRYNDRILLGSYFYKKTHKVKFTDSERELLRALLNDLSVQFNMDFDYLENVIKDHILNFKYEYKQYKKLLTKKNPKQVYVVVAYENKALVKAARDLGIEVLELQHGTISNYHMGYSYPDEHNIIENDDGDVRVSNIEYFPDKILSFGKYWENASFYPLSSEALERLGTDHIDALVVHRISRTVPVQETVAELNRLKEEGKIRAVLISNSQPADLDEYEQYGYVAGVQEKFSLLDDANRAYFDTCSKYNAVFQVYGSLEEGFLAGPGILDRQFGPDDVRAKAKYMQEPYRKALKDMYAGLEEMCQGHGCSFANLVQAWTLRQYDALNLLTGFRRRHTMEDTCRVFDIRLNDEEVSRISALAEAIKNIK